MRAISARSASSNALTGSALDFSTGSPNWTMFASAAWRRARTSGIELRLARTVVGLERLGLLRVHVVGHRLRV